MSINGKWLYIYEDELSEFPLSCPIDITKLSLRNYSSIPSYVHKLAWVSSRQLSPILPSNITHIQFFWEYNHKITKLPHTVTNLTFCDTYPDDFELPDHVTHLYIVRSYDRKPIKLSRNIRALRGINITDIPFIFPDDTNIEVLITNALIISKDESIKYDWLYYLLEYRSDAVVYRDIRAISTVDLVARCAINRSNIQIKQTAFYDLLL